MRGVVPMTKKGKLIKYISVALVVIIFVLAAGTTVSAADRSGEIQASQYRFNLGSGIVYNETVTPAEGTLDRWARGTYDDNNGGIGLTANRQYDFYMKNYKSAVRYWNNNIESLINNINKISDDVTFTTYKEKLDVVYSNYLSAVVAGDSCLLKEVDTKTIVQNNTDISNCIKEINTVQANYRELIKNVTTIVEGQAENKTSNKFFSDVENLPGLLWKFLGFSISHFNSDTTLGMTLESIETIAYTLMPYVKVLAYLILIIAFGTSVAESSWRNEITTARGAIKVFARVIIGKVMIDLSVRLCLAVINVVNTIAANMITGSSNIAAFSYQKFSQMLGLTEHDYAQNLLVKMFSAFPYFAISVITAFLIIKVLIKLMMRNFELGCLLVLAPVGFATLAGETTKRYFTRYVGALLSSSFVILFIAITYKMISYWMYNISVTQEFSVLQSWIVLIVVGAMSKFIWNPPQVFKNLFSYM